MRTVNLYTVVVMKFAELIALIALAVLMTVQTVQVLTLAGEFHAMPRTVCSDSAIDTFEDKNCFDNRNGILIAACVLAWYHILHHNLLVNLRLSCWIKTRCCIICWFPVNWLMCKFGNADKPNGCQFLCRDRCFKP